MSKDYSFDSPHPKGVVIHEPCNLYGDITIGENTRIGSFCDIGPVSIGKNCIIQTMVSIPVGVVIEDNVFIGPQVVFTNDKNPPSDEFSHTVVRTGARIGANATILPGVTIGEGALIGAGAVVTKDVPAHETWVGNPARKLG